MNTPLDVEFQPFDLAPFTISGRRGMLFSGPAPVPMLRSGPAPFTHCLIAGQRYRLLAVERRALGTEWIHAGEPIGLLVELDPGPPTCGTPPAGRAPSGSWPSLYAEAISPYLTSMLAPDIDFDERQPMNSPADKQPIETAPKDGSEVDLWIEAENFSRWEHNCKWANREAAWQHKGADGNTSPPADAHESITHWRKATKPSKAVD